MSEYNRLIYITPADDDPVTEEMTLSAIDYLKGHLLTDIKILNTPVTKDEDENEATKICLLSKKDLLLFRLKKMHKDIFTHKKIKYEILHFKAVVDESPDIVMRQFLYEAAIEILSHNGMMDLDLITLYHETCAERAEKQADQLTK